MKYADAIDAISKEIRELCPLLIPAFRLILDELERERKRRKDG